MTDAAGKQTTFGYDNVGNQTQMTDALQHTTSFTYDRLGRRTLTTYPDLSTDSQHYDFLGRMDSKTDQAGKITQYGYDNVGRLTLVTQTLNPGAANQQNLVTTYAYDEVGERISQTDANGHVTKFGYDQLGRRSSRTLPAGGAGESYVYDAAGNLHLKTDFNGHTTTYAYDNMNRLQSKTADAFFSTGTCVGGACGATSVSFTYTATGRRKSMTDATGTTNYTYDTRDRLLTKATPFGTVTYTYDVAGNDLTLSSSNASGASMTYGYDALNRLASVTDPFGAGGALETTRYSYDAVGNLAGYAYPNGVSTGYGYDNLNRLTSMQATCTTGTGCAAPNTVISSYAYTLGSSGNRLSVAELSGRSVTYGYDDLYRLTSETVASDPRGNNGQVTYTLDNVGNRLQLNSTLPAVVPTGPLRYDANDRVSTDTFDANGNTTINSGQTNVYDFENHLLQRGGVSVVYDGDGNRVKETVAGVATSYLVADQNPTGYAQVLDEIQGGSVTRTYSYGLELINERQTIAGTLTTSFYGYDGHGSVRFLTDSTGAITDTYDYDAFGNVISSTGSTPNNYLFAGEQFDPALGIYYNRARYYDQRQGRFWTMDTFEGDPQSPSSLHKYLYAKADPILGLDPTGLATYSQTFGYAVEDAVQKSYVEDFGNDPRLSLGGWTRLGNRTGPAFTLKPDILDLRPERMIWMDVKPFSFSGIIRAAGTSVLYGIELSVYGVSPDTQWLKTGRLFNVMGQKVLVFNEVGILFYTTNQQDYDRLQIIMTAALGVSGSAALGATAGLVVNALTKSLPAISQNGSELQQINNLVQIGIKGGEAEAELETGLDIAI